MTSPIDPPLAPTLSHDPAGGLRRGVLFLVIAVPLVVVAYQGLPFGFPVPARAELVVVLLLCSSAMLLKREGRSLADLGMAWSRGAAAKLLCGLAGGALLFSLAALTLRAVLPFHWERSAQFLPSALAATLLFHLSTNLCEELAFRGYGFDKLIQTFGHWPAQGVIALMTALFHVVCGWPWQVALVSTTAGSLLFGLVFVHWRSVPAAVGVHAAWNCSRDVMLGMPPTPAAAWHPVGMERWTPAQWNTAQIILVGITLAACAVIARQGRKRSPLPG